MTRTRFSLAMLISMLASLPAIFASRLVVAQTAAPTRPFASPDVVTSMPAGGAGSLGQVTLALLLVLGAVFGVAWLIRRLRGFTLGGTQAIEIVAQVGLGSRERAVLVKVAGIHVLLGVAPGRVNALHVLPADATIAAPKSNDPPDLATRPNFKSLFMKSLGK